MKSTHTQLINIRKFRNILIYNVMYIVFKHDAVKCITTFLKVIPSITSLTKYDILNTLENVIGVISK